MPGAWPHGGEEQQGHRVRGTHRGSVFAERSREELPPCSGTGVSRQPQCQDAKVRPHQGVARKASQHTELEAGAAMWAAKSGLQRGCRPLPLPVSQSWHRCAGGRGSAPGLAGWSCPHGPQHSHTAALGASSRLASPPGSAGRARGGEHSPTCTSAPTQGVGWGMSPSLPHQCGHATATAAWQSSSRSANILTLSRRPICKVFFPFLHFSGAFAPCLC